MQPAHRVAQVIFCYHCSNQPLSDANRFAVVYLKAEFSLSHKSPVASYCDLLQIPLLHAGLWK